VIAGSVLVYNLNRTIIYQENIDCVLIRREDFTEIQRIPGGQILNGQEVSVDYQA